MVRAKGSRKTAPKGYRSVWVPERLVERILKEIEKGRRASEREAKAPKKSQDKPLLVVNARIRRDKVRVKAAAFGMVEGEVTLRSMAMPANACGMAAYWVKAPVGNDLFLTTNCGGECPEDYRCREQYLALEGNVDGDTVYGVAGRCSCG